MAGRRAKRLQSGAVAAVTNLADPTTSKAVDQVRAAAQRALDRVEVHTIEPVDLAVGTNVIPHSLGRVPRHVSLTPTAADASFSWAWKRDVTNPERQLAIVVVGVAQPRASLQVS